MLAVPQVKGNKNIENINMPNYDNESEVHFYGIHSYIYEILRKNK